MSHPPTTVGNSMPPDPLPTKVKADILYQDADLVVLNKPSGLLVHRGWANDRITALSLARAVARTYVYPVHRLDRSASGVLVFATSGETARLAQEQLQSGRWHKEYVALVRGHIAASGVIDYPLAAAKDKPKRPAISRYSRLATFERYSLVHVEPESGRLHQIRRHLRHLSHPLIGDVRYGKAEHNRIFRERFDLQRLCLHAVRLSLPHPVTGESLLLHAPLPPDLELPFSAMGFETGLDWLSRPVPVPSQPDSAGFD